MVKWRRGPVGIMVDVHLEANASVEPAVGLEEDRQVFRNSHSTIFRSTLLGI